MESQELLISTTLWEPLTVLAQKLLALVPSVLGMVLILLIGLGLSWLFAQSVERLSRVIRLDVFCQRVGLTNALHRGGITTEPSALLGRLFFWLVLSVAVLAGLAVLHLDPINKFTQSLLAYVPHLLTAVIIILGGFLLSNFLGQAVLIAAVNAGAPPARWLAGFTRWGIQLAAVAMALEQLGIAETIVVVGFGIAFGGVVLAAAIAFGLGAKDLAKEFLEQRFSNRNREQSSDDIRHL